MLEYLPEGLLIDTQENRNNLKSLITLQDSLVNQKILESRAIVCDSEHNLIVDLGCIKGIIPRDECAVGIADGTTKDIAIISRVNKPVCFKITSFAKNSEGKFYALLS
ncbi:MAG: ribosomal protein, partial [Oscillospiraceae bacterium]|nr:ribosomal protein [Oscillospiraceae bacterium]